MIKITLSYHMQDFKLRTEPAAAGWNDFIHVKVSV